MDKQQRLMLKQLGNHQHTEENLPKFAQFMCENYYDYAMLQLAMNLYTFSERSYEHVSDDPYVETVITGIQRLIGRYVVDGNYEKREAELSEIQELRLGIIKRMEILTSYTDCFQIYQHILNRLEYTGSDVVPNVNTESYAQKLFRFIFQSEDKMVINTKIQQIVSELPVRISKNRFYDILNESLKIYTGAECSTLDDFADSILTSGGLKRPDGFDKEYPKLYALLTEFESYDYMTMTAEQVVLCNPKLQEVAEEIEEIVTDYLMLQDIVNELYAVMLMSAYVSQKSESCGYSSKILGCVLDSLANQTDNGEMIEDCLFALEGTPEEITPRLLQGEGLLLDLCAGDAETMEQLDLIPCYKDLSTTAKLLGNSPFMDLGEDVFSKEEASLCDSVYVKEVFGRMSEAFSKSFMINNKLVNRARMATVMAYLPVFFNSQEEIKNYIVYALEHCNNDAELRATVELLDELMAEEI